jgi:hypothetical protein
LRYFGRYCEESWTREQTVAYAHQIVLGVPSFFLMLYAASRVVLVLKYHASRLKTCKAYFTDNAVVCVVLFTIYPLLRCAQYVDPFGFHGILPDWFTQTIGVICSTLLYSGVALFLRIFVVVHAKLHKPSKKAVTAVDILAVLMIMLHLATILIYPANYTLFKSAAKLLGAVNIMILELYGIVYSLKVLNPLLSRRFDSPGTAVYDASLTLRRIIYVLILVGFLAVIGVVISLIADPGYRDAKNLLGTDMFLVLLQLTVVSAIVYVMQRRAAGEASQPTPRASLAMDNQNQVRLRVPSETRKGSVTKASQMVAAPPTTADNVPLVSPRKNSATTTNNNNSSPTPNSPATPEKDLTSV